LRHNGPDLLLVGKDHCVGEGGKDVRKKKKGGAGTQAGRGETGAGIPWKTANRKGERLKRGSCRPKKKKKKSRGKRTGGACRAGPPRGVTVPQPEQKRRSHQCHRGEKTGDLQQKVFRGDKKKKKTAQSGKTLPSPEEEGSTQQKFFQVSKAMRKGKRNRLFGEKKEKVAVS